MNLGQRHDEVARVHTAAALAAGDADSSAAATVATLAPHQPISGATHGGERHAGGVAIPTTSPAPDLPVQNMDGSWVLARLHAAAPYVRRATKPITGAPPLPDPVQAGLVAWPPAPGASSSREIAAVGAAREAVLPVDGADRIRRLFQQAEAEETDADFARFAAFAPEVHRAFRDGGAMKLRPVVVVLAALSAIVMLLGIVRWYYALPGREAAAQLIEVRAAVLEARQAQTSLNSVIGTLTDPEATADEISTAGMGVASVVDNVAELDDVLAAPLPAALPFTDTTLVDDLSHEQASARTYEAVLGSLVARVVALYTYRLDSADVLELELPTAAGALDDAALIDLQVAVERSLADASAQLRELSVPPGYEAHAAAVGSFVAGARAWWDETEGRLLTGETVDWPAAQETVADLRVEASDLLSELLDNERSVLVAQLDSIESTGQQLVNTIAEADVSLDA